MTDIDEISLLLGELKEGIKQLDRRAELAESQRREIQTRLDGIENLTVRVETLERAQKSTAGAISAIEAWKKTRENWVQQGVGGMKVVTLIWGATVAVVYAAIEYFWPHR